MKQIAIVLTTTVLWVCGMLAALPKDGPLTRVQGALMLVTLIVLFVANLMIACKPQETPPSVNS